MEYLWVFLSFIVMFTSAFSLLILKHLTDTKLNILVLLGISYMIAAIFFALYILFNQNESKYTLDKLNPYIILFIFLFSVTHLGSQFILSNALKKSPNIAYCHLIVNLNIIVTLIIGYFLFREKINFESIIGILIALFGLSIVIYYSNR